MENFKGYYHTLQGTEQFEIEKYYYYHHLTASCYLRLGRLKYEKHDNEQLTDNDIDDILSHYRSATQHDPQSFYAWHAWALMNYQAIQHYEVNHRGTERSSQDSKKVISVVFLAGNV